MRRQQPVRVELPAAAGALGGGLVLCVPAALGAPGPSPAGAGDTYTPCYVGALMAWSRGELPPREQAALQQLAGLLAPHLVLRALPAVAEMSRLLYGAEDDFIISGDDETDEDDNGGGEEDEAPAEGCAPPPERGGIAGGTAPDGLRSRGPSGKGAASKAAAPAAALSYPTPEEGDAKAAACHKSAALPPQGPLLRFLCRRQEAAFLRGLAASHVATDAICLPLFCLCFVLAAAVEPRRALGSVQSVALLAALAAPLLAMAASVRW